jgi:hypothetical protein
LVALSKEKEGRQMKEGCHLLEVSMMKSSESIGGDIKKN